MNKTTILMILVTLTAASIGWYFGKNHKAEEIPEVNDEIVAVINQQVITKSSFIEDMKLRGGRKPGQYHDLKQRQILLDYLISQEVLFSNAEQKGITKDPVVMRLFKKAVIDRYLELELNPKLANTKVDTSEVKAYFNNNKQSYDKPSRRRAAILFIGISEKDDSTKRSLKREFLQEALNKVSDLPDEVLHFGELAKMYSDD